MDFFADFKPTQTISISPPGGTHHPHHHAPMPPSGPQIPGSQYELITSGEAGRYALWVVFVIMTVGLIGVGLMAMRVEKKARLFHWLSAGVLCCAMVSYLAMATGLGVRMVPIHNSDDSGVELIRQVYYARYIDWLFTTPLLLVSLAFLAGVSPADTVLLIIADVFMIVVGLLSGTVAAQSANGEKYRWFMYAISNAFFLVIWYILLVGGRKAAAHRPSKTRGLFYLLGGITLILWTAYPFVFAFTEGANTLSVDTEIIAYGVLDVAAKVGFTFLLLIVHNHGEDDTWILPDWFVEPRKSLGTDGRGGYGSINAED